MSESMHRTVRPDGRVLVSSGTPWEDRVGYSRAVRVGPMVFVSGTLATDAEGVLQHPDDAGAQTTYAIRKIERALESCGARLADVVRTRMYVRRIDDQAAIGQAHAAAFGSIRPCATMIEVGPFAAPEALVEVEVEAVVAEPDPLA